MSRLTTRLLTVLLLGFGASLSAPDRAGAQVERADTARLRNACRLATQVIQSGHPANKRAWALYILPACGSSASRLITTVLQSHRFDATNSQALEEAARIAAFLNDRDIFTTALALARDATAGTAARVQAVRIVYYQLHPGATESYEHFAGLQNETFDPDPDAPVFYVTPLPTNALQLATTAGIAIRADSEAAEQVKLAARWLSSLGGMENN